MIELLSSRRIEPCQSVVAARRIEQTAHFSQSRDSPAHHVTEGWVAAKEKIVVRLCNPMIRQIVWKKAVQSLIDPNDV